jgi:PTS system ascorbate-specific IIC component
MSGFLDFFVQFFSTPAIVLGLVALLGLLVQRKTWQETMTGTLKTVTGYLIMTIGIGGLIATLSPLTTMFGQAFKVEAIFRWDEPLVTQVAPMLGSQTALILMFGFLFSLLLARVTPFKYIYLTGHHLWVHAGEVAILMWSLGLSGAALIVSGTILVGFYYVISPWAIHPFMKRLIGSDEYSLGHGNVFKYIVSISIARLFGKSTVSTEEMPAPKGLEFMRDMAISMSLIMLLIAIPSALLVGPEWVEENLSAGQHYLIYSFLIAVKFTAGVLVLLQGVRMLIAELIPAFRGISQRVVPGAVPALDVPVVIPFGPTALMLGTIIGTVTQFLTLAGLALIGWPVPLPSMIGAFFGAGHVAVLGNAIGGRRTAFIAAAVEGIFNPLLGSWAYKVALFGDLTPLNAINMYPSSSDAHVLALIVRAIGAIFGLEVSP